MPHFKSLLFIIICCSDVAFALSTKAHSHTTQPFKTFKWSNRVLLVYAHTNPNPLLAQLERQSAKIDNRDLVWFVFYNGAVTTNSKTTLSPPTVNIQLNHFFKHNHKAVLLGKDGAVKLKQQTLNLKAIFDRIDSMPMRIQEMRDHPAKRF